METADADIAAGPLYIVVATNEQCMIYDRNYNLNLVTSFQLPVFFGRTGASIFDPKVAYDPWRDRYIILALEANSSTLLSYHWVAISQTNNPAGSWWVYGFPAHMNGGTTTSFWGDFPGLGFSAKTGSTDSGAVVITTNQYNYSSPAAFQYNKVRCLNIKQIYNGLSANYWDFWNWTDANSDKSFTVKPSQNWFSTANGNIYLANTKPGGGNVVTVWQLANPHWVTTGPTASLKATITTSTYAPPTTACKTPSAGTTLDPANCRTQDVIYQVGKNSSGILKEFIYTALTTKYVWSAADTNTNIYNMRINLTDNVLENAINFGSAGTWFMFPKVAPRFRPPSYTGDTVGISFCIGSSTKYLSSEVIGYDPGSGLSGYWETGSGTANYESGSYVRNGDYNGICIDPKYTGSVWTVGMVTKSGGWGTGIGLVDWNPNTSGINNISGLTPSKYNLYQNYPNPFNPSTTISFDLPVDGFIKLTVYDVTGKEIVVLANEFRHSGTHDINFNASNLSSGVYYFKLTAGDYSETKKMILNK
jgi:hypothetical protein